MRLRHLTGHEANALAEAAVHIWVLGPELPEDVEADGLLTAEDHRDLTLDHIARTCEVVVQFQIVNHS